MGKNTRLMGDFCHEKRGKTIGDRYCYKTKGVVLLRLGSNASLVINHWNNTFEVGGGGS